MIINGRNLGQKEVTLSRLTDFNYELDEKEILKKPIEYIENLYISMLNQKDIFSIKSFPSENDKVIIKPGMINHSCSSDFDTLKCISQYGVLASEWFGILESEREGCFCTFVSRMKNEDYTLRGDLAEDNYSRLTIGDNVLLFFDETHPIMKHLIHLDYFEYEGIKKYKRDQIPNIYTKEEIELFDKLIEPLSPGGKHMRYEYNAKTNYWSAIPGGIPSFLINGICIKNNKLSEEEIEEVSKLFPSATIFNGSLDIVHYPYFEKQITNKKYS